jgi:2Fe-2S ferredoxin
MKKFYIHFIVNYLEEEFFIKTYLNEYKNLMQLLREKVFLDDFGECQGTGKCGTCLIEISGITGNSQIMDRNEPNTLIKMGINHPLIRLSCQILVSPDLHNASITIIDKDAI